MAEFVGELLFAILRGFVASGVSALFVNVGTRLDRKISGRTAKIAVGMIGGLCLYFLIPILFGLLGL